MRTAGCCFDVKNNWINQHFLENANLRVNLILLLRFRSQAYISCFFFQTDAISLGWRKIQSFNSQVFCKMLSNKIQKFNYRTYSINSKDSVHKTNRLQTIFKHINLLKLLQNFAFSLVAGNWILWHLWFYASQPIAQSSCQGEALNVPTAFKV